MPRRKNHSNKPRNESKNCASKPTTTPSNSNNSYNEPNKSQAESIKSRDQSNKNQIECNNSQFGSNEIQARSNRTQTESNEIQARSDEIQAKSNRTQIESSTIQTESNATQTKSNTTQTESNTTQTESNITQVKLCKILIESIKTQPKPSNSHVDTFKTQTVFVKDINKLTYTTSTQTEEFVQPENQNKLTYTTSTQTEEFVQPQNQKLSSNSTQTLKIHERISLPIHASGVEKFKYLGCWIHLNHFLNCNTETCEFYATIRQHLKSNFQINKYDIILVPIDRKLTNYWEGLYSIICKNFVNCQICLNLFLHLNMKSLSCYCNIYDITDIQEFVAKLIEMYPIPGRSFNSEEAAVYKALHKEVLDNLPSSRLPPLKTIIKCKDSNHNSPKHSAKELTHFQRAQMNAFLAAKGKQKNEQACSIVDSDVPDKNKVKPVEKLKYKHKNGDAETVANENSKNSDENKQCRHSRGKEMDHFMTNFQKWKQLQSAHKKNLLIQPCTEVGFKCYFCEFKINVANNFKYEGILIPDFCVKDRCQTTCGLSWEESQSVSVLRQYCLSINNLYIEPLLIKGYPGDGQFEFEDVLHPDLVHIGFSANRFIKMRDLKLTYLSSDRRHTINERHRQKKICDVCIKRKKITDSSMETSNF